MRVTDLLPGGSEAANAESLQLDGWLDGIATSLCRIFAYYATSSGHKKQQIFALLFDDLWKAIADARCSSVTSAEVREAWRETVGESDAQELSLDGFAEALIRLGVKKDGGSTLPSRASMVVDPLMRWAKRAEWLAGFDEAYSSSVVENSLSSQRAYLSRVFSAYSGGRTFLTMAEFVKIAGRYSSEAEWLSLACQDAILACLFETLTPQHRSSLNEGALPLAPLASWQ